MTWRSSHNQKRQLSRLTSRVGAASLRNEVVMNFVPKRWFVPLMSSDALVTPLTSKVLIRPLGTGIEYSTADLQVKRKAKRLYKTEIFKLCTPIRLFWLAKCHDKVTGAIKYTCVTSGHRVVECTRSSAYSISLAKLRGLDWRAPSRPQFLGRVQGHAPDRSTGTKGVCTSSNKITSNNCHYPIFVWWERMKFV